MILTFLFIIFLPVAIILGPFLYILIYSAIIWPAELTGRGRSCSFLSKIMVWLVFIFIVAPLVVALGMTGVVIADAFAILPLYYYSISFLIRLSIAGCRTKL